MTIGVTLSTNGLFEGYRLMEDPNYDDWTRFTSNMMKDLFTTFEEDLLQYGAVDLIEYTMIEPFTMMNPSTNIAVAKAFSEVMTFDPEGPEAELADDLHTYEGDFDIDMTKPITCWGSASFDGGAITAMWIQQGSKHFVLFG